MQKSLAVFFRFNIKNSPMRQIEYRKIEFYQLFKYFKDIDHRQAGNSGYGIQATYFKETVRIV